MRRVDIPKAMYPKIRKMVREGYSSREIRREFGFGQEQFQREYAAIGIRFQHRTPARIDQETEAKYLHWVAEGRSVADLVRLTGRSKKVVYRVLRKLGLKPKKGYRRGPSHGSWTGGKKIDKSGYVLLHLPQHPNARGGYVREHRVVMERKLGRFLLPEEVVHHLNGDRADNRPQNLEVFESNAEHLREELAGRCPKWTRAGKARILAGCAKGGRIVHQIRARDAKAKR